MNSESSSPDVLSSGTKMAPTATQILQAVARGWCHPQTSHKEMDPDLAIAIAAEVNELFSPPSTGQEAPTEDGK